jgi:hypothetical protein
MDAIGGGLRERCPKKREPCGSTQPLFFQAKKTIEKSSEKVNIFGELAREEKAL